MNSSRRVSHVEQVVSGLQQANDVQRFKAVRALLNQYLIHTRTLPNGKDFLFSGPCDDIHAALKDLVAIEHGAGYSLQLDYARIEEYFLLRIVGGAEFQEDIAAYFT